MFWSRAKVDPTVKNLSRLPPRAEVAARTQQVEEATGPLWQHRRDLWAQADARPSSPDALFAGAPLAEALGPRGSIEIRLKRVPGHVLWCNFDLLERLGFDVPKDHRMTLELERQLVRYFSYQVAEGGEPSDVVGRADRYGGLGVGLNLGAARGGELGIFYGKGLGRTGLCEAAPGSSHGTGTCPAFEGIQESGAGAALNELLPTGATEVAVIVDQGARRTVDGKEMPQAVVWRAWVPGRPAHLEPPKLPGRNPYAKAVERAGPAQRPLDTLVQLARLAGVLVERPDPESGDRVPDVAATLQRLSERHALADALLVRNRILHGAVSLSNTGADATALDFGTLTSNPRSAPIYIEPFISPGFGREHLWHAEYLDQLYRDARKGLGPRERARFNVPSRLDVHATTEALYQQYLTVALVQAMGLPPDLAAAAAAASPAACDRFKRALTSLAELTPKKPGLRVKDPEDGSPSTVDVFNFLRRFPAVYFTSPGSEHRDAIDRFLAPRYAGSSGERRDQERKVQRLSAELERAYAEVMETARRLAPEATGLHSLGARRAGERRAMDDFEWAVISQAKFENAPLSALFRPALLESAGRALAELVSSDDPTVYERQVDDVIARSHRDAEALLLQGQARRLADGGLELERRTLRGIHYAVRAPKGEAPYVRVEVPLAPLGNGSYRLQDYAAGRSGPGRPLVLTRPQLDAGACTMRFTVRGWKRDGAPGLPTHTARGRLEDNGEGPRVVFELKSTSRTDEDGRRVPKRDVVYPSQVASLELELYALGQRVRDGGDGPDDLFRGFSFKIPTGPEVERVAELLSRVGGPGGGGARE